MRTSALAVVLTLVFGCSSVADEGPGHVPQLLLSAKLLKRLKRDRERQTARWTSFETRVKNVPDSPERGFELALHYAITGDETRGKQAVEWALAHDSESRQVALVMDWCADLLNRDQQTKLTSPRGPGAGTRTFRARRDCLFRALATGNPGASCAQGEMDVASLVRDPGELYAASEYFAALREAGDMDQRGNAAQFFAHLPVEYLLSLKPKEVEHPDWMVHVAALALVSLDPNLEASQFLQGWAMEDRQTLRDGPGVAYELLWADPYLPGIAYQNLDPWFYDSDQARLIARSDWSIDACWISSSKRGVEEEHCPAGWQAQQVHFGSLTLLPLQERCFEPERLNNRETLIVWKLEPFQKMVYRDSKHEASAQADAAGMWRLGSNVEGKICAAK